MKVVSFDVEGTLVDHRFSALVWEEAIPRLYAQKEDIDLESGKRYVLEEYAKVGERRLEWYDIRYWLQKFGLREDWRKLLESYKREVNVYPEVPTVLERLKDRYVLIVVSNSAREFVNIQMKELRGFFKNIFSATTDFRMLKNTTNLYEVICNRMRIEPNQLAHVGDTWEFDYVVPRKLGVLAYLLDRAGSVSGKFIVKDLESFCNRIGG